MKIFKAPPILQLMLIVLVVMFLALFFSSCATQKRCSRKFPPWESITVRDSVAYTYRDTTLQLTGPSDTVRITNPCDPITGHLRPFYHKKETPGKPTMRTYSDGKSIVTECDCPDTNIVVQRYKQYLSKSKETVEVKNKIIYKTPWQTTVLLWALIVYTVYQLIRKFFK